jgi:two-component system, cell cycle response regulator DivK
MNQAQASTFFLEYSRSRSNPVYRVMIVEDHDDTRLMLRTILESLNFGVVEASDGESAFQIALEQTPDLILMDAGLPRTDGFSVTRKIRQNQAVGHVPIVFLSGHALPSSREEALLAGGNDYLVKPIDIDEMLMVMARLLSPSMTCSHAPTARGGTPRLEFKL